MFEGLRAYVRSEFLGVDEQMCMPPWNVPLDAFEAAFCLCEPECRAWRILQWPNITISMPFTQNISERNEAHSSGVILKPFPVPQEWSNKKHPPRPSTWWLQALQKTIIMFVTQLNKDSEGNWSVDSCGSLWILCSQNISGEANHQMSRA